MASPFANLSTTPFGCKATTFGRTLGGVNRGPSVFDNESQVSWQFDGLANHLDQPRNKSFLTSLTFASLSVHPGILVAFFLFSQSSRSGMGFLGVGAFGEGQ